MNGDMVARIVAGLSAVGLLAIVRAILLVPALKLSGWMKYLCYAAAGFIILCLGLLLLGMVWGLIANWPAPAKSAMMIGWFMAVPAVMGSVVLLVAGIAGSGPAKGYFIGLGIVGILLLALPALIMAIMAGPGRP